MHFSGSAHVSDPFMILLTNLLLQTDHTLDPPFPQPRHQPVSPYPQSWTGEPGKPGPRPLFGSRNSMDSEPQRGNRPGEPDIRGLSKQPLLRRFYKNLLHEPLQLTWK